jgi:hypothetical protein
MQFIIERINTLAPRACQFLAGERTSAKDLHPPTLCVSISVWMCYCSCAFAVLSAEAGLFLRIMNPSRRVSSNHNTNFTESRAAASFILELLPQVPLLAFRGGARTGIKSYAFCSASVRRTLHIYVLSSESMIWPYVQFNLFLFLIQFVLFLFLFLQLQHIHTSMNTKKVHSIW